ncbi:MAG: 3'-5' exonuclease [Bacteroidales bacterium]|nr:3'-5' exonuclease [Bacteroidales bacterium]MCF8344469.1 3'-5' exonuclease [Bacteroidales bacterium]MCF8350382.1 3'-5' exonuclease [Bacteroidales bacterium]MCF8375307.1 3'-5' exonuclease [Bacteroidales bacterium]MCF8400163.1 3'-5' exonuclease [Bacteroidales bacterium]
MELNLTRPIAFFDLETTGLNIGSDRIVEISIYKLHSDGNSQLKTYRINPTIPISAESTSIHGITNADVENEPTFKELAPELNQLFENCDLAGYNSNKFDIPLLVEEFLRADIEFDLRNRRFIDVQNIFHKMEPRTLKAAYKFYCKKDLPNAHTAEADTLATFEILKAQLDRYKEEEYEDFDGIVSKPVQNDMQALHEFSYNTRNVDLVGHVVFNEKQIECFNFGKYKGKPVEEVFSKEPQYYDWMMKAKFPRSTKRVITAIKLRNFNQGNLVR